MEYTTKEIRSLRDIDEENFEKLLNIISKEKGITSITIEGATYAELGEEVISLLRDLLYLINIVEKRVKIEACEECKKEGENAKELLSKLRRAPIESYVGIKRLILRLKAKNCPCKELIKSLEKAKETLEKSKLIQALKPTLIGYKIGDRSIYNRIIHYSERVKFSTLRVKPAFPLNMKVEEEYTLQDLSEVRIFSDGKKRFYHLTPYVFTLKKEDMEIIEKGIKHLSSSLPLEVDWATARRIGEDITKEFLLKEGVEEEKIEPFTKTILSHSLGFGIIESILFDEIEDIFINSTKSPVFVRHSRYGEMETNILPGEKDLENWIVRIKVFGKKAFDEVNPMLDYSFPFTSGKVRVSVMGPPITEEISYAFRKHRPKPWTLEEFLERGFLSEWEAGLLSLIAMQGRTLLIAGSRGAGKTSLLSSLLFELPKERRIIIIEDTPELPYKALRELGFNVIRTETKAFYTKEGFSAEEILRGTLRMGDSSLILGEVRGKEARTLYEAMRVGALSSFVSGTIHAETPFGVFDRVVNDLGVPPSSFKATDFIVMVTKYKDPSGNLKKRAISGIYEVDKFWEEHFTHTKLTLENLKNSPTLREIAKELNIKPEEVVEMIKAIGRIKSKSLKERELSNVVKSNEALREALNKAYEEKEITMERIIEIWRKVKK